MAAGSRASVADVGPTLKRYASGAVFVGSCTSDVHNLVHECDMTRPWL